MTNMVFEDRQEHVLVKNIMGLIPGYIAVSIGTTFSPLMGRVVLAVVVGIYIAVFMNKQRMRKQVEDRATLINAVMAPLPFGMDLYGELKVQHGEMTFEALSGKLYRIVSNQEEQSRVKLSLTGNTATQFKKVIIHYKKRKLYVPLEVWNSLYDELIKSNSVEIMSDWHKANKAATHHPYRFMAWGIIMAVLPLSIRIVMNIVKGVSVIDGISNFQLVFGVLLVVMTGIKYYKYVQDIKSGSVPTASNKKQDIGVFNGLMTTVHDVKGFDYQE